MNTFSISFVRQCLFFVEKLQFFGNDPENTSAEVGQIGVLHCRVQTNDPTAKIQWLKKINGQHVFRPDAIVFGSEQYETIQQSPEHQYSNNILSKPLIFPQVNKNQAGEYICLIQNDKATNYRKVFLNILHTHRGKFEFKRQDLCRRDNLSENSDMSEIKINCLKQIKIHPFQVL